MEDIKKHTLKLAGTEVKVTAKVNDFYYLEERIGSSAAYIYGSTVRMKFLGGTIRTFNPSAAFQVLVSITDDVPFK